VLGRATTICGSNTHAARRFLVCAAFLADRDFSAAGRLADAAPPKRPPFLDGE
jgi:hypothetical protein